MLLNQISPYKNHCGHFWLKNMIVGMDKGEFDVQILISGIELYIKSRHVDIPFSINKVLNAFFFILLLELKISLGS